MNQNPSPTPTPKDAHAHTIVPGTCKYVTLNSKGTLHM